jgi:two-component system, chemotaxis family, chemotaxis protein CheY
LKHKTDDFKGGNLMARVLIVDDAAFMRGTLKIMLERNGYEIAGEAENGEEAIAKYIELEPDIVTLDITMPKMDGVRALKSIVQIDRYAKVVMVSAMGQETLVRESIINGAKGFVVKPFKEETVVKALEKLK